MTNQPVRSIYSMSETTKNILASVLKTVREGVKQPTPEVSPIPRLKLADALASGQFAYVQFGIYKQADTDTALGKVWEVRDIDGEKWLVAFTDDEEDIIHAVANEQLQVTAADKQPNPKDVPLAQGIKSKNITIDETGAQGTAKVTVEFTDVEKGYDFYKQQGAGASAGKAEEPKAEAPKEEVPAEGEASEEGAPEGSAPAEAVPSAKPSPQGLPQQQGAPLMGAGFPAQSGLVSTVQVMTRSGAQAVTVVREVVAASGGPKGHAFHVRDYPKTQKRELRDNLAITPQKSKGPVAPSAEEDIFDDSRLNPVERAKRRKNLDLERAREHMKERHNVTDPDRLINADDEEEFGTESSLNYYFVNEKGNRVNLKWASDLRVGEQFERPDTGQVVRLAGYREERFSSDADILASLIVKEAIDHSFAEGDRVEFIGSGGGEDLKTGTVGDLSTVDDGKFVPVAFDGLSSNTPYGLGVLLVRPQDLKPLQQSIQGISPTMEVGGDPDKVFASNADITDALLKEAADISDDLPPMGLENKDSGNPEGAKAPLPPNQNLQNNQPTQSQAPDKGNVLYDSQNDKGPQFQTVVNPKDKSVTVKFLDSPEEDALNQALGMPPGGATPGAAPGAPKPPGGGAAPLVGGPQGEMKNQEVPVQF